MSQRRSEWHPEMKAKIMAELRDDLLRARRLSKPDLAAKILEIGFACSGCGECCLGEDNSVLVFPREIREIQRFAALAWPEVARPPEEGEWDRDGFFHTLEWRLEKEGESCRFYRNGLCSIYSIRPMLCRTYPFYLDRGELMLSECRGLGGEISMPQAEEMAGRLIMRHIIEIEEALALLENYRDFERGEPGKGGTIVHDSEGEHRIKGGEMIG
jgi:uncharacterized protein